MKISIEKLNQHPELVPGLVDMWCESLGHQMPDVALHEVNQWYQEWLSDSLPMAYVALVDDLPVASFSLQWDDGVRPDLYPWLGDVIVSSDYRNRGIGRQLVQFAMKAIKQMGFETLYLFTFEASLVKYYSQLGWQVVSNEQYSNQEVIVMSVDLLE